MRNYRLQILLLLSSILVGCRSYSTPTIIDVADSLLWSNPDSCHTYLLQNMEMLPAKQMARAQLILEHASFKRNMDYDNDSVLQELAVYFDNHADYRSAGEARYVEGALYVQKGMNFEATEMLKEAEFYYRRADKVAPILYGMLYFNLGVASERNRLFDIASEYYIQSLPYLKESQKLTYISAAFHNLGKSCNQTDIAIAYMDSAMSYAVKNNDVVYQKVIEVSKYYVLRPDSYREKEKYIDNLIYLSDSCMYYSFAGVLGNVYIDENMMTEAERCLCRLANDTSLNIWSRESYYSLQAEILKKKGAIDEAYTVLKQLHTRQTTDIENSAFANTYIIAQRYEAAKEQEMRLKETVEKQRAYIGISISVLICFLIGGLAYYIYWESRRRLELGEAQKRALEQELYTNRIVLRTRISERLEVARQLRLWGSHHPEPLPNVLNILSPKQAASDMQNWKEFYKEFNLCYNNLLSTLKDKYTDLTDSDLQYIALTYLDFDVTDISFLLGIEKRTIWNRRSSVKQHLGMPEDVNLDDWITKRMGKEYHIAEPTKSYKFCRPSR